jgi:hypothetical protein
MHLGPLVTHLRLRVIPDHRCFGITSYTTDDPIPMFHINY